MDEMTLGALAIGGVAFMLALLGLYMLRGKGAFLIAGYNTMPKEEKAEYDGPAMARFIGAALVYMNTGGRFLKQPPASGHEKNK